MLHGLQRGRWDVYNKEKKAQFVYFGMACVVGFVSAALVPYSGRSCSFEIEAATVLAPLRIKRAVFAFGEQKQRKYFSQAPCPSHTCTPCKAFAHPLAITEESSIQSLSAHHAVIFSCLVLLDHLIEKILLACPRLSLET